MSPAINIQCIPTPALFVLQNFSVIDAPITDAAGNPITDAAGNPITAKVTVYAKAVRNYLPFADAAGNPFADAAGNPIAG